MAKAVAHVMIELVQPQIVGTDFDAIKAWIKANITDKLPPNATETHHIDFIP